MSQFIKSLLAGRNPSDKPFGQGNRKKTVRAKGETEAERKRRMEKEKSSSPRPKTRP